MILVRGFVERLPAFVLERQVRQLCELTTACLIAPLCLLCLSFDAPTSTAAAPTLLHKECVLPTMPDSPSTGS